MSCDPVRPVTGPISVLGAGTMGRGIAQVSALAGYETRLFDISDVVLADAAQAIEANLEKGLRLGKVEPADRERALERLALTSHLDEALDGVDLVVEAVPEQLELKRNVLQDVAGRVAPTAVIGSNTSSISISALAQGVEVPERVIGLHFFNPVHIMALVEVVRGDRTAETVVEQGRQFVESLGKTPILVKDSPGFASSRLGVALGLEAIRMLEEGVASAEDIDQAMVLGYRHPMGPLRLTDLVGLDVRLAIAEHLHRELGSEAFRPPEILRRMVAEGRLGKKAGRGFYEW